MGPDGVVILTTDESPETRALLRSKLAGRIQVMDAMIASLDGHLRVPVRTSQAVYRALAAPGVYQGAGGRIRLDQKSSSSGWETRWNGNCWTAARIRARLRRAGRAVIRLRSHNAAPRLDVERHLVAGRRPHAPGKARLFHSLTFRLGVRRQDLPQLRPSACRPHAKRDGPAADAVVVVDRFHSSPWPKGRSPPTGGSWPGADIVMPTC